jgi:hypothetical protein
LKLTLDVVLVRGNSGGALVAFELE